MDFTKIEHKLPHDTTFVHKHNTERNWRIAEENLLVLFEAGSTLHGTRVSTHADYDLYGICVEPPEVMLGVDNAFEEYHYRSVREGERSGDGDVDCNVYGLNKWVFEAAKGNFNHLLALFVPHRNIVDVVPAYADVLRHRELFLARTHGDRILGYLSQQRRDIMGQQRPELVEAHGYDTKSAYHALRIALQGWELLTNGEIRMPMLEHHRETLLKVRQGYYSLDKMLEKIATAEADLALATKRSLRLSERIDYDAINAWLSEFYQRFWENR